MDDADRADAETRLRTSEAIRAARNNINKPSAHYCEDCDEVIEPKRRAQVPGVRTCVFCQTIREKKGYV